MIVLRKATLEDIAALHDFNLRLAKESENLDLDSEVLHRGLESILSDPVKGQYFLAVDDEEDGEGRAGTAVGCLAVTFEWSDWRNGWIWWLQSVYVKESHRKRGVFRLLFGHIMELLNEDSSIKGVRLYADKANVRAHKTYKAMGMQDEHYKVFELMKS